MRAYHLTTDSIDGLVPAVHADPEPGHGEVLLRVEATSLNRRDLVLLGRVPPCRIPLSDGAGTIVAVGPGVDAWAVGDRVAGCFHPTWTDGPITEGALGAALGGTIDGTLTELMVLSEAAVVATPRGWTAQESATLPCAGVTAWNALIEIGRLRSGDSVLLIGTGVVSVLALQIAAMLGIRAIVTSGSDEKLAIAADLGAAATINTARQAAWHGAVLEQTDGRGVDLVLEVGGPDTFTQSVRSVRFGGTIAAVGMVSGDSVCKPRHLIERALSVHGVRVGSRRMFQNLVAAIDEGGLVPLIDRVFGFDEPQAAYHRLAGVGHVGKLVIDVTAG